MVNARLCKTAKPVFFSARPTLSGVFGLRGRDSDATLALQKIQDCETFRTMQNTRLQDP